VNCYGVGKHLEDYGGDKDFAGNESARATFSKLRSSIAGLYAWRAEHSRDTDERDRMYRAADLAFRQSYAKCPNSPEAIWRYVNLLISRRRFDEAILIVKSSLHLEPDDQQLKGLLSQLMRYR
jgi:predicted Zn-dependent protease